MTGYGKGEQSSDNITISVSVTALNSRFFDCNVKMPRSLNGFEEEITQKVKDSCKRGRITVNVDLKIENGVTSALELNQEKLDQYLGAVEVIQEKLGREDTISVEGLLGLPEIINQESALDEEILEELLLNSVIFALDDLEKMRKIEGENLGADLIKRVNSLSNFLDNIEIYVQNSREDDLKSYREKLKSLMQEVNLDENRLLQEIVIQAEKRDITEEITRLRSHLKLFTEFTETEEAPGKKMNFLQQEMVREVNTIGSKTTHIEVSHMVVNMKEELEKIKEQVQNIL